MKKKPKSKAKFFKQIKNVAVVTRVYCADLVAWEKKKMEETPWADVGTKKDLLIFKKLDQCLNLLGFTGFFDTVTEVKKAVFIEHKEEIFRICAEIIILRNFKSQSQFKDPVDNIRNQLEVVFGTVFTTVKVGKPARLSYKIKPSTTVMELVELSDFYVDYQTPNKKKN